MDFLANLRKLLGIDQEQPRAAAQQRQITGATRPEAGVTPYSPGEGPQTQGFLPQPAQPRTFVAPTRPIIGAVDGSIDPRFQIQGGNTPYSPGEGPRTIFDQLLRRR